MTILVWATGWLIGIAAGSLLDLPPAWWLAMGGLAIAAAVCLRHLRYSKWLLLLLAAAALGAARYQFSQPLIDETHIAYYNGQPVAVSGLVASPPIVYETYQNVVVAAEHFSGPTGTPHDIHGRLLARLPREADIGYGDRLLVTGELEQAGSIPLFDYAAYLARQNIWATMDNPAVDIMARGAGNPLRHGLLALRQRAQASINTLLPQPQAALLSGILLGNDDGLPSDLEKAFQASGMTHIIAISGFNMALIAGALLNGGRHVIGRRAAAWIALTGIATYALFVGAGASVVRAALMGALFVVASALLGRPTFMPAALMAAAFAMTLINPNTLWDVGFQLSFAATLGLMLYVGPWSSALRPRLQSLLGEEEGTAATRAAMDVLLSTMAALIMTLPLLVYHFHTFSLVSPLANLLILPVQPGVMVAGGAATIGGMVHPWLGQLPAWIAWLLLTYTITLARFFGGLPWAMTAPLPLSDISLFGCYALIGLVTWSMGHTAKDENEGSKTRSALSGRTQRHLLLGGLLVGTLVIAWASQRSDGRLHVAFLDVGQGDATFIQTPDGRQMLVDGGRYPSLLLSRLGEQMPFWDKELDLLVITHADDDHAAGLADLFGQYDVGQVLINGAGSQRAAPYEAVLRTAAASDSPIRRTAAGERIDLGTAVQVEVLHAGDTTDVFDDNNDSIVLRLTYDQFSLLLTGDAELPVEEALLREGQEVQSTVLKAGHHGSKEASSARFLQAVRPQMVIISAGARNRYGHPHEETLRRITASGALILRTDEQGTLELISDGEFVWHDFENDRFMQP